MISVRTDLAIEAKQAYTEENKRELDGVKVDEEMEGEIKITTVTIESDEAGRELGKPKGHYITIDFPEFTPYDGESMDDLSLIVGKVMKRLVDISSWIRKLECYTRFSWTKSCRKNNDNKTFKASYARCY